MGYNNPDLIFSNIAKGKYTFKEVLEKYDVYLEDSQLEENDDADTLTQRFLRRARGIAKGVTVGGIENTMISYPKCCSPIPGDDIIGYVTRGRGVTIHRSNCKNLPIKKNKDRIITVEWDLNNQNPYGAEFCIWLTTVISPVDPSILQTCQYDPSVSVGTSIIVAAQDSPL